MPAPISPGGIGIAAACLSINVVISLYMKLDIHWRVVVGAIRCVCQLLILGLLFATVFSSDQVWPVILMTVFMLSVASFEAYQRPKHTYPGFMRTIGLAMTVSCFPMALIMTNFVLSLGSMWWHPRYYLPMLGMMTNNGLSAISLAADRLLTQLVDKRAAIEAELLTSSHPRQVILPIHREAVRVGMMPTLNTLAVVGLVAIPGMMAGQLLGGADPLTAAKYQIVVTIMIASTSSLASFVVTRLMLKDLVNKDGTLRFDDLHFRGSSGADFVTKVVCLSVAKLGEVLKLVFCCGCVRKARRDDAPSRTPEHTKGLLAQA
ncbi:conserved hypothetical protein [Perkinsus marinus ATCC 50983]|uniref:Uncharacterized protein n=1 Tax=Perkinsus marinus (strain ATCC 50983 / TXsc) TaxID=423536 RepID=C5L8Y5_PERM5|nr:conserved hypothetical protein [Perkinsus marinus ATCC 50983]EER06843.1 conserved hypothetical protein [Perkinsus marinus ATCC 50983]|eukprot:XP_002775027.1 conserved hypothetical protein [Perkinsus marinus ATCC 50983]